MESVTLNDIAFDLDIEGLRKQLHIKAGTSFDKELQVLLRQAREIARPKALYRLAFVDSKGDDHVVVDGIEFTSRVLRVNLEKAQRVFPYVATCGTELEEWSDGLDGTLVRFCADAIKQMALGAARQALDRHLQERYRPGRLAYMSPGSLQDWPLQAQRPLFALLGNVEEAIGVRLTSGLLMTPIKSVSGIRFPTEESFESCQLCPREDCPGRRAPYDKGLYDRKYRPRTE